MQKYAILALTLVAGLAHAQSGTGALLFTPRPPSDATEVDRLTKMMSLRSPPHPSPLLRAVPVLVNPRAPDSAVITVTIEGKSYRFVGEKKVRVNRTSENGEVKFYTIETWKGVSEEGDTAEFEMGQDSLNGHLDIDGYSFRLHMGETLVQTSQSYRPFMNKGAVARTGSSWAPEVQAAARKAWARRDSRVNFVRVEGVAWESYVGYCDNTKVVAHMPVRNCEELPEAYKRAGEKLLKEMKATGQSGRVVN
jgi:hypothetical protein